MRRIDAHQHFWQYDSTRDSWITDEMKVLKNDFLPADLQRFLHEQDFDGSVLVQSEQTEGGNEFLLQQARDNEFIKGIVAWVDLQAGNIEERLAYYKEISIIKGFRHILQGEENRALMLQPSFLKGIRALHKFDFTYDILIYPDQLTYASELVAQFPDQPFVLDHLAKPYIKKGEINDWKKEIKTIARNENVCCKISGLVTEGNWKDWKKEDFYPYLDVVTEAFGTSRIIYGSDWPVCLVAASYEQQLNLVQDYYYSFSNREQQRIFGLNAIDFYKLT